MKKTGILFILGAIGVFVPYTILTIIFGYPDILREPAGTILAKFNEGGIPLILTWWAFAVLGLPLIVAYSRIGALMRTTHPHLNWATTLGITGLIAQMIGLLRWVFVVPVLAQDYTTGDAIVQQTSITAFKLVHQFGGVLLREYIGQLFTIIWTIAMSRGLWKAGFIPRWITVLGYIASAIYLLAQTELFQTVIPSFPVVGFAGFVGSTLWLVWLVAVGISFIRNQSKAHV
jgi:hypothetical protein